MNVPIEEFFGLNMEVVKRLHDELIQLKNEITIFERLIYKNTNQHRRCLYFRRLSQVRRDLRLLQSARLDEVVESSIRLLCPSNKNVPNRSIPFIRKKPLEDVMDEDQLRRRLLGIARLLEQMSEPALSASLQIAGLLSQTFFMPFALTIFGCLARFRVLLQQVLLDIVHIFNLISAQQRKETMPAHIFKIQRGLDFEGTKGKRLKNEEIPLSLQCQWDGIKFSLLEKVANERTSDDNVVKWFVDDRTGRKYSLSNTPNAGESSSAMAEWKQVPTVIFSEECKTSFQQNSKNLGQENRQDVEGVVFMQDPCIKDSNTEEKPQSLVLDLQFTKNEVKEDGSNMSSRKQEENVKFEKIEKSVPSPEDFSSLVRKDGAEVRKTKESGSKSIELGTPILKSKQKVAYVSVDPKSMTSIVKDRNNEPEKFLEGETFETVKLSSDSKKKRTDALFDMLVGTGGNPEDRGYPFLKR